MPCQFKCSPDRSPLTGLNNGIWWVASYPKSGNTWFRAFLTSLLADADTPVSIDSLSVPWGISRRQADMMCGLDTSLLLPDEISLLWPDLTRRFLDIAPSPCILKTHAALDSAPANGFLHTPASAGAIYLVRNPLDVCVSFAHHLDSSIDDTITIMLDQQHCRQNSQRAWRAGLTEVVSSWHANVESWMQPSAFPVLILRYEDLLENPQQTFRRAVDFMGCVVDDKNIDAAIANSRFEKLQAQELQTGFREKSVRTRQFFRQGKQGGWKQSLSVAQVNRIVGASQGMMEQLGY